MLRGRRFEPASAFVMELISLFCHPYTHQDLYFRDRMQCYEDAETIPDQVRDDMVQHDSLS
jgi:hypothetical protein